MNSQSFYELTINLAKELAKERLHSHHCQLIARIKLSIDDSIPDTYYLSHQYRVKKSDFHIISCQSHPLGIRLDVTLRCYSKPLPVKNTVNAIIDKPYDLINRKAHVFTNKDIHLFLSKTNDHNPIHQCDHPIVPGMLIMTSLPICFRQLDLRFIAPLYSDEPFWVEDDRISHTFIGYTAAQAIFTGTYI